MGPRPPDSQSVLEPMGRFIPHNRVRGAEADRGQSARMHIICLLVEVRGNDRGISVEFRGCCHELPWKSPGFHGKGHGSWHFHGKYHGCGHGTCRGSVRGKLRGTNHGNPRKSAAIATAISADVKPQQFPRPSAAIATAILRYAAITTEVRGNCHGNFRRRQTTEISTAIRGHPRPLPREPSDTRQSPRKSAAITTAISTDVKPQQFPRPSTIILRYKPIATEVHVNCHSNFHGIARPSAAIELPR